MEIKTFSYYCTECKADDETDFGLINYNPAGCGSEYLADCVCGNLLTEIAIEASDEEIDRDKPACLCKDCSQAQLETPYSE
jgi:hypothetical protein